MKDDYNKIAEIEQAIKKKYGENAIKNPLSSWTQEKEEEYVEQIKEISKKEKQTSNRDKERYNGFFVDKKLLTKDKNRECPVCHSYSFSIRDDTYLAKWDCCYGCYVQWVEDREERWATGWRPELEVENG
ncbi:MAG: hypothetical protein NWE80_01470 [Candidatus Bathyarchaeota archaeon]|nr:hypothetical protein [Candidatus Bathyarchaeota archaeon]